MNSLRSLPRWGHGATDPGPSPRQVEFYRQLFGMVCETGRQPGYAEMVVYFGFRSRQAVYGYIHALERRGWLATEPGRHGVRFLRNPDGTPFRGLVPRPEEDA